MSALSAVEGEGLWILSCDLGGGVWGWVGNAGGLALGAGVEAVNEGEDEGGGGGKKDVAGGLVSGSSWKPRTGGQRIERMRNTYPYSCGSWN